MPRSRAICSVDVECNAFGKAVDVGFHLDELQVHVIGARLAMAGNVLGAIRVQEETQTSQA
jgi:hypothetical protein